MSQQGDPGPGTPPPGEGQPPAGDGGKGDPPPGDGGKGTPPPAGGRSEIDELRAALGEERKALREAQQKFSKLEQQHMSEQEKAIAAAKDEGKAEALKSAGKRLAAAEFRAAAAGKIADPSAALEWLDLGRLVGDDGEPDGKAIAQAVDRLAAAAPPAPPANGRIPAGARTEGPPESTDFISEAAHRN